MNSCRRCGVILTNDNSYSALTKKRDYICRACLSKQFAKESLALKTGAMRVIGAGRVVCVRCGCDDIRVLELNYKPGGHTALTRRGILPKGKALYRHILSEQVDSTQFEILCRAHNSVDHLEKNYGIKWEIKWIAQRN